MRFSRPTWEDLFLVEYRGSGHSPTSRVFFTSPTYNPATNRCLGGGGHVGCPRLVSHLIFGVWHGFEHDLFLCGHKSILPMLSCYTYRLLVDQHFAPYNMASRIAVLYNLSFSFCCTLEAWHHFNQTALILWLTLFHKRSFAYVKSDPFYRLQWQLKNGSISAVHFLNFCRKQQNPRRLGIVQLLIWQQKKVQKAAFKQWDRQEYKIHLNCDPK
jgi:hypothetical protein